MDRTRLEYLVRQYLVSRREAARLSQGDVAARSDVFGLGPVLDQRTVSRIEQQPLAADNIKLAGYLSAVGDSLQNFSQYLENLTTKGAPMAFHHDSELACAIRNAVEKVEAGEEILKSPACPYLATLGLDEPLLAAKDYLKNLDRKPIIGFFGHYDAGKSTLINTVIGQNVLPAKYAPATCVVNLLVHKNDQPESITGPVALFRKGFKPHMLYSPELVAQFLMEDGDFSILDRLGVHNYDGTKNDAYIAVIFAEIDILQHLWLLDTPGDLNNDSEDGVTDAEKALGGAELADGVVFLSSHTGFFGSPDIGFCANILRNRPPVSKDNPMGHILFIQSHCHSAVTDEDIRRVQDVTFIRIAKQFEELVFRPWREDGFIDVSPDKSDMSERVQAFWRERDNLRNQTLSRIQALGEFLSENHADITALNIKKTMKQVQVTLEQAVVSLEAKKASTLDRMREVQQQDARFREESKKLLKDFDSLITACDTYKGDDMDSMKAYYDSKSSPSGLEALIRENYSSKKDAQNGLGNYFGQIVSAKLESTLKRSGGQIAERVDIILERWQRALPNLGPISSQGHTPGVDGFDVSGFNSKVAFISGLAGLGSLGAMALYVSTIASNLGAYILVAKFAGLLVSLGLVGSVATVTSFVAAIGGPITIGIAIASAIALAIFSMFSGPWQETLAKKASKAIQKKGIWFEMEKNIETFWDSTKIAITKGLESLQAQTEEHIEQMKADAKVEYDVDALGKCIVVVETAKASLTK